MNDETFKILFQHLLTYTLFFIMFSNTDLHLESYRKVSIEIWTHAIGGLSENDFVLAAKIDEVPIQLPKRKKKE